MIQRYRDTGSMVEDVDGAWVLFDDYAKLRAHFEKMDMPEQCNRYAVYDCGGRLSKGDPITIEELDADGKWVLYSDFVAAVTEHRRWKEKTIERLQDICEENGCSGGFDRLDFLRDRLRFQERKLEEMRAALELSLPYVNGESKQSQNIRQKVLNALSEEK